MTFKSLFLQRFFWLHVRPDCAINNQQKGKTYGYYRSACGSNRGNPHNFWSLGCYLRKMQGTKIPNRKKKQAKKQWEACKDQLVKVSASIKLMDGEQLCLVREFRAKYHPDHYVYTAESRADAYYRNGSSDIITKGVVIDGVHYSPNSIKSVTMTFA